MGKMEAIAPDSLWQHSGECPYAGLGTWGYLAMNAGTGALRASDLSLGLLPLLPNLPDLPSTFLDNQKFHSLWCLLSKTPRAEKSPPYSHVWWLWHALPGAGGQFQALWLCLLC